MGQKISGSEVSSQDGDKRDVTATEFTDVDKRGIDVAILGGEVNATSGLAQGLITVISVGTTATALPATPATGRNHISIHNKGSETLYVDFENTVTADDASTGGWEIPAGNTLNLDLKENVLVYGIYPTTTNTIKVMEL